MNKNNKTLTSLVKKEAGNLKKFATKKELQKLNFNSFCASMKVSCIYGQITGHCLSDRATVLMQQCAPRVYKPSYSSTVDGVLNGPPGKNRVIAGSTNYWSPIEIFVAVNNSTNNKILIDFLKGKTEALEFDFEKK